jgi:hypothetical protein
MRCSRSTGHTCRSSSARAGRKLVCVSAEELVSKVAFVVGGLEASGSGARLDDPVGTLSRAGIRSREAPVFARFFERAQGRRRSGGRAPTRDQENDEGARLADRRRFESSERPATFETSSQEMERHRPRHPWGGRWRADAGAATASPRFTRRLVSPSAPDRAHATPSAAAAHRGGSRDLLRRSSQPGLPRRVTTRCSGPRRDEGRRRQGCAERVSIAMWTLVSKPAVPEDAGR